MYKNNQPANQHLKNINGEGAIAQVVETCCFSILTDEKILQSSGTCNKDIREI